MSTIKVLGVSGSPRKGKNTGKLLDAALEAAAEAGAETEHLSFADLKRARAEVALALRAPR